MLKQPSTQTYQISHNIISTCIKLDILSWLLKYIFKEGFVSITAYLIIDNINESIKGGYNNAVNWLLLLPILICLLLYFFVFARLHSFNDIQKKEDNLLSSLKSNPFFPNNQSLSNSLCLSVFLAYWDYPKKTAFHYVLYDKTYG